jgi:hypothetical protein
MAAENRGESAAKVRDSLQKQTRLQYKESQ